MPKGGTGSALGKHGSKDVSVPTWHDDFRKDLARVEVPALVIQGDAGRIVPIAAAGLRTAKLIKRARLLAVKDRTHCITWTHAEEVNREQVKFLG
jgi:pimeloyl-ACP methyl ester carboxylesterase